MPTPSSSEGDGAPSGVAGGDLGGTYPNPTVDLMTGGTVAGALRVAPLGVGTEALVVQLPNGADNQTASFRIGALNVAVLGGSGDMGTPSLVLRSDGLVPLLDCIGTSSIHVLQVDSDNQLGFFGGTVASQQTLHSATATPESLALALEASTLMTGD